MRKREELYPNVSALHSKHLLLVKLDRLLLDKLCDYTILNDQSKHFSNLKKLFSYRHLENLYANTDTSAISANNIGKLIYIRRALIKGIFTSIIIT